MTIRSESYARISRWQNAAAWKRYGDIIMLYDMINTYGWFFSRIDTNYVLITNHYIFPVFIFLVKYAI